MHLSELIVFSALVIAMAGAVVFLAVLMARNNKRLHDRSEVLQDMLYANDSDSYFRDRQLRNEQRLRAVMFGRGERG